MRRFLKGWIHRRRRQRHGVIEPAGVQAGRYFAAGYNCAQAVLLATTAKQDPALLDMAKAFGGGIGGRKCLCGAISGGVMALGLGQHGGRAGELVDRFKARHKFTCCKALSAPYSWLSQEHKAHCRRLTEATADDVALLLTERVPQGS